MLNIEEVLKQIDNKVLMVVYPHPDDETFGAGGLLLRAKKMGWKTIVVCLTKGGAGKIFVHGRGRSVIEIRQQELEKAAAILKATTLVVEDFGDARLLKEVETWEDWLKKTIEDHSPSVIVTYDHSGLSAHPDHIIISVKLLEIIKGLKNKPLLFWNTLDQSNKLIARNAIDKRVVDLVSVPTHLLSLSFSEKFLKFRAFLQYKSQYPFKVIIMLAGFIFKTHTEWYHMVDLSKAYKHKFVEFKL